MPKANQGRRRIKGPLLWRVGATVYLEIPAPTADSAAQRLLDALALVGATVTDVYVPQAPVHDRPTARERETV